MDRFSKYCKIISGYAFKAKDLMEESDIPVIKIGNISNGGNVNFSSNTQYVDKSFLSLDEKYHIKNRDILISLTGSHMNQPNSMVGRSCRSYDNDIYLLNQRAGKVIPFDNANKDYLYYLLSSEEMKYSIVIRAYGAANQVNISPSDIEGIKWDFPEYDVQCKIGKILANYDDLIEKNNRKIQILQDMAEELYKEWFVRFRFPGHEIAKFTDGIPDGWEYKPFSEVVTYERGVSYSSDEIDCEDGINLINLKNINSYGGFRLDGTKKYNGKYRNGQIVECGDLVMGVTDMTQDRRTVGAVALVPHFDNTCVISADLVKLNSDIDNLFIYSLCRYGYYSKFFSQFANGSNVLHLKPSSLRNQKVLIPREDLIDSYVKVVKPINNIVNNLNRENDNLKQQRDLLLPRLMSGKLEVKVS